MKPTYPLHGLVAATHTPFAKDGSLNLAAIEQQAAHLLNSGISTVFIGGSTGESSSLTVDERRELAHHWSEVARSSNLRLVVHVGANCLAEARVLATHAESLGAMAISALAPSYFKPRSLDILIACCADVAGAAPATPFYYYDIPSLTGVSFSMADFLAAAPERIPTLAGLKFTNPDLMAYQFCLRGEWDVPFGLDEYLLGALAMGARGAVGSGFNFAAPIYSRMLAAFARGDMAVARNEQLNGVRLIQLLSRYGYIGAAKAVMTMLGVNVGPARLPNNTLSPGEVAQLRRELESMGFFDWITLPPNASPAGRAVAGGQRD